MKFTILGYSQENSISIGLDLQDLLILRYIADFSPKMDTIQREGKPLFWVLYSALLEDIPMCGISSKDVLGRRLKKMAEKGVLTHAVVNEKNGVRGTFSFWGFGENYMGLVDGACASTQESEHTDSKVCTVPTSKSAPYRLESRNKDQSTIDPSTKDPSTKYNAPASRDELERELQNKSMTYYSKPLTPDCLRIMVERMYTYYDPDNTGVWRYKGKPVKNWKACCGTYLDPHGYSAGKLRFVEPEKTAKERWGQESVTAEEWAKNAPRLDGDDYFDYMKTEGK